MEVTFQPPHPSPPSFTYGRGAIYMSSDDNIPIAGAVEHVALSSCQVHADT
jgi:hypothetical protein